MTDFNAEAREAAKRIPDPPPPPANVIPFPSRAERWSRQWTRPMPEPEPTDQPPPSAA